MTPATPRCPEELIGFAHRLAEAAAAVHRRHYRRPVRAEIKADATPVTECDRETEAVLRDLIRATYPGHGILGEELGGERTDAELVWVLDPIDGTKDFLAGKPVFGALIALAHGGAPILGVIEQAITRERWVGADGHGAWHNGEPITARPCARLADAMVYVGGPRRDGDPRDAAVVRVGRRARWFRPGADCYSYGLVALGTVDAVADWDLAPVDFAALDAVVRGAGGRFTDWQGRPITLGSDGHVLVAGDPRVHAEARSLLADQAR